MRWITRGRDSHVKKVGDARLSLGCKSRIWVSRKGVQEETSLFLAVEVSFRVAVNEMSIGQVTPFLLAQIFSWEPLRSEREKTSN